MSFGMTIPGNTPANQCRRTMRARNKPGVTCAASRHVHLIAVALLQGRPVDMNEAENCGLSMLAVLESLWKARAASPRPKRGI